MDILRPFSGLRQAECQHCALKSLNSDLLRSSNQPTNQLASQSTSQPASQLTIFPLFTHLPSTSSLQYSLHKIVWSINGAKVCSLSLISLLISHFLYNLCSCLVFVYVKCNLCVFFIKTQRKVEAKAYLDKSREKLHTSLQLKVNANLGFFDEIFYIWW